LCLLLLLLLWQIPTNPLKVKRDFNFFLFSLFIIRMSVKSSKKNRVRPDNLSKKNRRIIGGVKILSNIAHYFQTQKRKDERLYSYAYTGNREKVVQYLSLGANPNVESDYGNTALIIAAYKGFTEIVKLLIAEGADLNIENGYRYTALLYAAEKGFTEIAKLLIDAKADLNVKGQEGNTALLFAAYKGHKEIVKLLIDAKADLNVMGYNNDTDGYTRYTALIYAAKNGYVEIVKLLIDAKANLNVGRNIDGKTALIYAAYKGHKEIVKLLIDAKAYLNSKDYYGCAALIYAASNGDKEIVKLLIDAKADLKIEFKGKNAYWWANNGKHYEIAELLQSALEDLNGTGDKQTWVGFSKSDIDLLDDIFHEERKVANNISVCPVCLKISYRNDGCPYLHHSCPTEGGFYHKELYNKYKSQDGFIWWCTICGRICDAHNHYKLGLANADKPDTNKTATAAFFVEDCAAAGYGGGLLEKIGRFRRLREYALELQSQIGKKTKKEAMTELVEQTWNAPLNKHRRLPAIMAAKKWNISSNAFPVTVKNNAPKNNMAALPNVKKPADEAAPEILDGMNSVTYDDTKVIRFHHKLENGELNHHNDRYISILSLQDFIKGKVASSGTDERFGLCWDSACSGRLYPEEIEQFFVDPENATHNGELKALFKTYKLRFNNKFKAVVEGGGRRTRRRQAKRGQAKRGQAKRGGANIANVFVPATNAQCNIRPRNKTMKQSNKYMI